MVHAQDNLVIKTQTTGFASPAESYVDKRLDLNELIVGNLHATFYFRYKGPKTLGVETNDILVIDRTVEPKEGDLVVLTDKLCFKIRPYENQKNLWGKVSWILKKKD
jgi:DNA polymerase V